jgi:hypothetical protein
VVLVVTGGQQGGPGEDVGPLAERQEGGLGVPVLRLLGVVLAGRGLPAQPPQVVGRGGQLGGRIVGGADVDRPGPPAVAPVAVYWSATSFSERDGRFGHRPRTHAVNVGGAVPHRSGRSDRSALLPAFL